MILLLVTSVVPALGVADHHDTVVDNYHGHSASGGGSNPNYHFWTEHPGGTKLAQGVHWSQVHSHGTVVGTATHIHNTSNGLNFHCSYCTGPHITNHSQGCSQ